MKTIALTVAAFVLLVAPTTVPAQQSSEESQVTGIVTMSRFRVPIGEDRAKVMEFVERMLAPQEKANPHIKAFYVLEHYYGADAQDVAFVRVYDDFADIEAPCGEPCETWMAANRPEEGTPEYEELDALGQIFVKYYASHSDEIYSASMGIVKN